MKGALLFVGVLMTSIAFAGDRGNGGDICENKIKNIANAIEVWLLKDEFKGLNLPSGINKSQYRELMLNAIKTSVISCVTDSVEIGLAEKTCKNFVAENGSPQIICNFDRFLKTNDSEKYRLIHHEFAGVAGLEINHDEASDYFISNQISGFITFETSPKLGVLKDQREQEILQLASEIVVQYSTFNSRGLTLTKEKMNIDEKSLASEVESNCNQGLKSLSIDALSAEFEIPTGKNRSKTKFTSKISRYSAYSGYSWQKLVYSSWTEEAVKFHGEITGCETKCNSATIGKDNWVKCSSKPVVKRSSDFKFFRLKLGAVENLLYCKDPLGLFCDEVSDGGF